MPRSRRASPSDSAVFSVETTVSSPRQAVALARSVTKARLAACAWILPLRSFFWWKAKLVSAREQLVVFKTSAATVARLRRFLEAHHAYQVPYIATRRLSHVPPAYLKWLADEARPRTPR